MGPHGPPGAVGPGKNSQLSHPVSGPGEFIEIQMRGSNGRIEREISVSAAELFTRIAGRRRVYGVDQEDFFHSNVI